MGMFFIALIGLLVGSFLNLLIDRLPRGKNVIWGRSVCDHCGKTLRWYELIPLASFFIQRGRCRRCHKKLSLQYPIVELVTGVGFVLIQGQAFDAPLAFRQGLALGLIFASLLVIFVADLKYQIIPDSMIIVCIVGILIQGQAFDARQSPALWLSALGASAFFLLLFLVTRGRGVGLGDMKLAFVLGLFLGYPQVVIAFYLAFLTGAVVGVILILVGKKSLKSRVAFAPFLIGGAVVTLFWGSTIIRWWKGVL